MKKTRANLKKFLKENNEPNKPVNQAHKEDNLNILDRFGKTVGCEAAQSTIKLFKSSHYGLKIKVFWFICLLVACSLAGFFVIQSLIRFVTFEVNTSSRTIFETASLFPKITYCNKNPLNTEYAFKSLESVDFNYNDMLFKMNYYLNDTEKLKLQHPFEKIMLECSYNNEKCTASDFLREFDTNLGNCYVFNSGFNSTGHPIPLKHSIRAGSMYGLKLTLYVNYYENLTKANQYIGAIIRIGNSSYNSINFGPEISPGYKTNIIVNRVFEEVLPKPYSECDMPTYSTERVSYSDLYDLISHSNYEYTQQLCYNACFHKKLIEICKCVKPNEQTFFTKAKVCSLVDACLKNVSKTFNYTDECATVCPLQCNRTSYGAFLSIIPLQIDYSDYVSNNFASDFITKPINFENVKNSITRIYIFYDSLSYTKLVEQTRQGSILDLAANIGGILGLFLGVSLLSIFEVVEVLIQLCFISNVK